MMVPFVNGSQKGGETNFSGHYTVSNETKDFCSIRFSIHIFKIFKTCVAQRESR
jgi:hypothetical protein